MIPSTFHEDAVPVLQVGKTNTKSLEVYSFQSLFATSTSTLLVKVLMTMMFKQNMNKNTENEFWRIMLWSFHWLFLGKWPPVDWQFKAWPEGSSEARVANTDLADGLRAVIWGIKGDLDVFATGLHLLW